MITFSTVRFAVSCPFNPFLFDALPMPFRSCSSPFVCYKVLDFYLFINSFLTLKVFVNDENQ
jgi:hypothetical protein